MEKTMQTITVPDNVAYTLKSFPIGEMEKHIITENGLTLAEEEEILRRSKDTDNISEPIDAQEYLNNLMKEIDE